jgi:outer membrane biogenesis lipoprotein LolB
MKFFTIFLIIFLLFSCGKGTEIPNKQKTTEGEAIETQYKQEMDEIKKSLKGEVKIKLKKDGKGSYSWEITGKDAQEVLKANEILRKKLND